VQAAKNSVIYCPGIATEAPPSSSRVSLHPPAPPCSAADTPPASAAISPVTSPSPRLLGGAEASEVAGAAREALAVRQSPCGACNAGSKGLRPGPPHSPLQRQRGTLPAPLSPSSPSQPRQRRDPREGREVHERMAGKQPQRSAGQLQQVAGPECTRRLGAASERHRSAPPPRQMSPGSPGFATRSPLPAVRERRVAQKVGAGRRPTTTVRPGCAGSSPQRALVPSRTKAEGASSARTFPARSGAARGVTRQEAAAAEHGAAMAVLLLSAGTPGASEVRQPPTKASGLLGDSALLTRQNAHVAVNSCFDECVRARQHELRDRRGVIRGLRTGR